MSIHRSLKSTNTLKRHRSVLSRLERVRILEEKGSLDPAEVSILGLPKVKHLKMRIRKEKAAAAEGAAAGGAATEGGAAAAAPAAGAAKLKAEAAKPKAEAAARPKK